MKAKKFILVIFSLVALMSFVGCGSSTANTSAVTETTSAQSSETQVSETETSQITFADGNYENPFGYTLGIYDGSVSADGTLVDEFPTLELAKERLRMYHGSGQGKLYDSCNQENP